MIDIFGYVLLYIGVVIAVAHILDLTYRFQTKEYRFDRFFVMLQEIGFTPVVYAQQIRFPARTLRNLLVIATSLIGLALVAFQVQLLPFVTLFVFIALAPVVSLILVGINVLATEILAQLSRRKSIIEAQEHIKKVNPVVIGITGSYGKTTTKESLHQILSAKYSAAKTEANMNTDVGIALSILRNVRPETKFFIAEMGAYKKGEIRKACKVARPKYAILTSIGNQHLGLFGSHDNLISAKKELLEEIPKGGHIYMNKAIEDRSVLARGIMAPITLYVTKGKADVTAKQTANKTYEVQYGGNKVSVDLSDKPPYALENLLPCVAFALDLGMKPVEIQNALKSLKNAPNKLAQQKGLNGSIVILDTANSSVEGFLAAIDVLASVKRSNKFAVTKGIIELGKEKELSYQRILAMLAKSKMKLVTTDRLFADLDTKGAVEYFSDEKTIASYLTDIASKKTAVLLEGRFTKDFLEKLTENLS